MMPPHQAQSAEAKRAETKRPAFGQRIFAEPALGAELRASANTLIADLQTLERAQVAFSPFLEIGAGNVQRSTALLNRYAADGVATDISQNSLRDAPHVLSLLRYERSPFLICCDAHHLPFLPDTFQFVFAYQTLHHFENPRPVVAECHRVLGRGGHLFFNEEPMDSALRRFLRGGRMLSYPPTPMQRLGRRLGVHKLFWDDGASERAAGITEARFDLPLWREALSPFSIVWLEVNRRLRIRADLRRPGWSALIAGVVGGNVKALCRKSEGEAAHGDFRERLMCLDCGAVRWSRAEQQLCCAQCGRCYPVTDGVIRMLPSALEQALYAPERQ